MNIFGAIDLFVSRRYFHNVRETTPSGGCMHVDETKVNPVSFPYHLNQNGYNVGYFGKHMNSCPSKPPPGFDCTSLSGSIPTGLTVWSRICVGTRRRGALPSPVCAFSWPTSC